MVSAPAVRFYEVAKLIVTHPLIQFSRSLNKDWHTELPRVSAAQKHLSGCVQGQRSRWQWYPQKWSIKNDSSDMVCVSLSLSLWNLSRKKSQKRQFHKSNGDTKIVKGLGQKYWDPSSPSSCEAKVWKLQDLKQFGRGFSLPTMMAANINGFSVEKLWPKTSSHHHGSQPAMKKCERIGIVILERIIRSYSMFFDIFYLLISTVRAYVIATKKLMYRHSHLKENTQRLPHLIMDHEVVGFDISVTNVLASGSPAFFFGRGILKFQSRKEQIK